MPFNEILAQLRTARGLTQEELSRLTGIKRSRISMYEQGKREPSIKILEMFADFFGVDIDTLIGRKDMPENSSDKNFIEYLASRLTPKGQEKLEAYLVALATDPESIDPDKLIRDTLIDNLTPEALEKRKALARELRIQRKYAKAMEREANNRLKNE